MRKHVTVTIEITVHDAEQFAAAAKERAIADGVGEEDLSAYTAEDLITCAIMLFDPGVSPNGCQIEGSCADIC